MRAHDIRTSRVAGFLAALALAALLAASSAKAATITIINLDSANEGFNDTTTVAPVGGNPGTTVGAQRLYVFNYAAGIWGGILTSNIEIRAQAAFNSLTCTPTSGVLGSCGPITVARDFATAPLAGHWYHAALANKLADTDLSVGNNDMNAQFNSDVGATGCLETTFWYYGLDGNPGAGIDLLAVVLHEMGHGLGFSTTTNGSTGAYFNAFPHVYDHFLLNNFNGLHWDQMTNAQRVSSATACNRLVWDGPQVTMKAPDILIDKPIMRVNAPGGIAGDYEAGTASFGAALGSVTGDVVLADDAIDPISDACQPLINSGAIFGKIALIDRGNCNFTVKVKNAQNAGAIGAIVVDNVSGCLAAMGGSDPTITIPSARITLADGNTLKANLPGVNATLMRNPAFMAGADNAGHVKVYTPNPFQSGSSISHWDVLAEPDLLMEPANTPLPAGEVDLTKWLFGDIGWFRGLIAVDEQPSIPTRLLGNAPNPFASTTAIHLTLAHRAQVELAVYDLVGRRVATLRHGTMEPGTHTVEWNGTDDAGRRAAPGVYMYRFKSDGVVESRRMVMWR